VYLAKLDRGDRLVWTDVTEQRVNLECHHHLVALEKWDRLDIRVPKVRKVIPDQL